LLIYVLAGLVKIITVAQQNNLLKIKAIHIASLTITYLFTCADGTYFSVRGINKNPEHMQVVWIEDYLSCQHKKWSRQPWASGFIYTTCL